MPLQAFDGSDVIQQDKPSSLAASGIFRFAPDLPGA